MTLRTSIAVLIALCVVSGCAQLPENSNIPVMNAKKTSESTALANSAQLIMQQSLDEHAHLSPEHTKNYSTVFLLNEGTDAFYARMHLISQAEESVDLQYYIWHSDIIGNALISALIKAADRGVRIRFLLDDFTLSPETQQQVYAMNVHPNIYVRLFNPLANRGFRAGDYLTDASRINRRMHNKSLTVDGQVVVIGGRNIGNEYFSADIDSNFRDIDALVVGPTVGKVEKQFDRYWNSEVVYSVDAFAGNDVTQKELLVLKQELAQFIDSMSDSDYLKDVKDSDIYKRLLSLSANESVASPMPYYYGETQVFYDDPQKALGKSENEIVFLKTQMLPHLENIRYSFEIISPYFVPGESGVAKLTEMVKQGITVRLLTNSLASTDGVLAQSGYSRHREALLRGGVEIYELRTDVAKHASYALRRGGKSKSGLHGKTYVLDRESVFIGSFNFDQRSANINSEIGVLYQIPTLSEMLGGVVFEHDVAIGAYQVVLKADPTTGKERLIWIENINGKITEYEQDPGTSWWRRFTEDFYSILPIESQL